MYEIHDRTTDERFYSDHLDNAEAFYESRMRTYPTHDVIINPRRPDDVELRDTSGAGGGAFVAGIRGGAAGTVRKAGTHG